MIDARHVSKLYGRGVYALQDLDPDLSLEIMNLARSERRGTTVLMATHDRELIRRVGRRSLTLDHGRIVEVS